MQARQTVHEQSSRSVREQEAVANKITSIANRSRTVRERSERSKSQNYVVDSKNMCSLYARPIGMHCLAERWGLRTNSTRREETQQHPATYRYRTRCAHMKDIGENARDGRMLI